MQRGLFLSLSVLRRATASSTIPPEPPESPPELLTPPNIDGAPEIGQEISAVPGTWLNATSVATVLTVGGVAVASPYTLLPADDGAAILLNRARRALMRLSRSAAPGLSPLTRRRRRLALSPSAIPIAAARPRAPSC